MYACLLVSAILIVQTSCHHQAFAPTFGKFTKERKPNFGTGPMIGPTLAAGNGVGLTVTSASPIAPTGLSILSENLAIDGGVNVRGNMPLLGSAYVFGEFPNIGFGAVSHRCGDNSLGITEVLAPKGLGYKPGLTNIGLKV